MRPSYKLSALRVPPFPMLKSHLVWFSKEHKERQSRLQYTTQFDMARIKQIVSRSTTSSRFALSVIYQKVALQRMAFIYS